MHWGRSTDLSHPSTFVDDGKCTRCKREALWFANSRVLAPMIDINEQWKDIE